MSLLSQTTLPWDGEDFFDRGLDAVALAGAIPSGFVYQGAQAWDRHDDGSFSVVLHREDPRFTTR